MQSWKVQFQPILIHNTTPTPEAQELFQKRWGKIVKNQRHRKFAMKFCILETSREANP